MNATRKLKLPNGGTFEIPMPGGRHVDISSPHDGSFGGAGGGGDTMALGMPRMGGVPIGAVIVGGILGSLLVYCLWPKS
jgi:hypothetical protein